MKVWVSCGQPKLLGVFGFDKIFEKFGKILALRLLIDVLGGLKKLLLFTIFSLLNPYSF